MSKKHRSRSESVEDVVSPKTIVQHPMGAENAPDRIKPMEELWRPDWKFPGERDEASSKKTNSVDSVHAVNKGRKKKPNATSASRPSSTSKLADMQLSATGQEHLVWTKTGANNGDSNPSLVSIEIPTRRSIIKISHTERRASGKSSVSSHTSSHRQSARLSDELSRVASGTSSARSSIQSNQSQQEESEMSELDEQTESRSPKHEDIKVSRKASENEVSPRRSIITISHRDERGSESSSRSTDEEIEVEIEDTNRTTRGRSNFWTRGLRNSKEKIQSAKDQLGDLARSVQQINAMDVLGTVIWSLTGAPVMLLFKCLVALWNSSKLIRFGLPATAVLGSSWYYLLPVLGQRFRLSRVIWTFLIPGFIMSIFNIYNESSVWTIPQLQEHCGIKPFSVEGEILKSIDVLSQARYHTSFDSIKDKMPQYNKHTKLDVHTKILDELYKLHDPARNFADTLTTVHRNPTRKALLGQGSFILQDRHWWQSVVGIEPGPIDLSNVVVLGEQIDSHQKAGEYLSDNLLWLENQIDSAQSEVSSKIRYIRNKRDGRYLGSLVVKRKDMQDFLVEQELKHLEALDYGLGSTKNKLGRLRQGVTQQVELIKAVSPTIKARDDNAVVYLSALTPENMRSLVSENMRVVEV